MTIRWNKACIRCLGLVVVSAQDTVAAKDTAAAKDAADTVAVTIRSCMIWMVRVTGGNGVVPELRIDAQV